LCTPDEDLTVGVDAAGEDAGRGLHEVAHPRVAAAGEGDERHHRQRLLLHKVHPEAAALDRVAPRDVCAPMYVQLQS
jgi:hypothetical protein